MAGDVNDEQKRKDDLFALAEACKAKLKKIATECTPIDQNNGDKGKKERDLANNVVRGISHGIDQAVNTFSKDPTEENYKKFSHEIREETKKALKDPEVRNMNSFAIAVVDTVNSMLKKIASVIDVVAPVLQAASILMLKR